jgi:hypothetical protein
VAVDAHNGGGEASHFEEDPDPHSSEKPNPHTNEKLDPDPHESDANLQPWSIIQ